MVHLQENLTQKFVKRGSWLYIFAFLTGPIGYAIKIIISHDLSVSEVGMLYGVLSFMLLVGSLNDLGMVESLNHFIPKFLSQEKYKKARAFLIYAGGSMLVTSLLSSLALWAGSHWLGTIYFGDIAAVTVIKYFCFYLIFSNILHWISNVFIIYQNTKFCKGIDMLRMATSLGFAFQIYHAGNGSIEQYAGIWNYGVVVASLVGLYFVWKLHLRELFKNSTFEFSKTDFTELFQYSLWALLASNA